MATLMSCGTGGVTVLMLWKILPGGDGEWSIGKMVNGCLAGNFWLKCSLTCLKLMNASMNQSYEYSYEFQAWFLFVLDVMHTTHGLLPFLVALLESFI